MIDQAIWWTGVSVLCACAALGASLVVAVITILAIFLGKHYASRFGNLARNLQGMRAWHLAGRPVWKHDANITGHVMRMMPSDDESDDV